jgi:endonuclease YncB( thermonuclease family)
MLAAPAMALEGAFSGVVRVIDGDTLDVGGARVRLFGIDAVETAQTCKTEQGRDWACGTWVKTEVARRYDGARARCTQMDTDRYGRIVARCTVAGQDIGAALVAEGLATAYRRYSTDYVALETAARRADRGLWAMQAQSPEAFRHAAPVAPPKAPVVAASGNCRIKGNISAKGERIYHLPGQRHYDDTRITTGNGERWFCSETAAQAAGWRRSRR